MAKINISINDDLLSKIDRLADENYTSRSGFIAMGMTDYINSREVVSAIKSMSISMAKIASQGNIDEETLKELETFRNLCEVLENNK